MKNQPHSDFVPRNQFRKEAARIWMNTYQELKHIISADEFIAIVYRFGLGKLSIVNQTTRTRQPQSQTVEDYQTDKKASAAAESDDKSLKVYDELSTNEAKTQTKRQKLNPQEELYPEQSDHSSPVTDMKKTDSTEQHQSDSSQISIPEVVTAIQNLVIQIRNYQCCNTNGAKDSEDYCIRFLLHRQDCDSGSDDYQGAELQQQFIDISSKDIQLRTKNQITDQLVHQWIKTGLQKIPIQATYSSESESNEFKKNVLVNDSEILIVNKIAGKRVTPFHRLTSGSVQNCALAYLKDSEEESQSTSSEKELSLATPVHRLDVHTSGVLVFAKTKEAATKYSNAKFWSEQVKKTYLAIVMDLRKAESDSALQQDNTSMSVSTPLDGKDATTSIRILTSSQSESNTNGNSSSARQYHLVLCKLVFGGRKHQIRRHTSSIKMPLLGDREYNESEAETDAFYLHAYKLEIEYDKNKNSDSNRVIVAPLSERFRKKCKEVGLEIPNVIDS